jgi:hypothetical protein
MSTSQFIETYTIIQELLSKGAIKLHTLLHSYDTLSLDAKIHSLLVFGCARYSPAIDVTFRELKSRNPRIVSVAIAVVGQIGGFAIGERLMLEASQQQLSRRKHDALAALSRLRHVPNNSKLVDFFYGQVKQPTPSVVRRIALCGLGNALSQFHKRTKLYLTMVDFMLSLFPAADVDSRLALVDAFRIMRERSALPLLRRASRTDHEYCASWPAASRTTVAQEAMLAIKEITGG